MSETKTAARVLIFESLDSTNEEALRQLNSGCESGVWIVAKEQSQGRGRSGRRWESPKGNLYASLLLRPGVSASVATQLSFAAALAAYDAIASRLAPEALPCLRLKWPNDVMLGGAKIAGILIESLMEPKGKGLAAIVGIGINVRSAPEGTGRPVTALGQDAAACIPLFDALAAAFDAWLKIWNAGAGFAAIRTVWLDRAFALNESVSVSLNGAAIRGTFLGIDRSGALQLETEPGVVITVNAGDIYPGAQG